MAKKIEYRPDIDGLRAVAVLVVVGFHAWPKSVPNGFIGVDIFFVISGFLISSWIVANLNAGSFSFLDFYARRVRRLFPALIVMLLAVWAAGWFILLPAEYASVGRHILAGAGFAANILTFSEIGYFDSPAATKPLLHLWSLGVEEQFYLVIPALLFLLWRRRAALPTLAIIGVLSFALNVAVVARYPSFTFCLPFTRLWEFVAGMSLACGMLRVPEVGRMRDAAAAVGLLLIIVAMAVTKIDRFPGWYALLPVLGAVLLIGAGPSAWLNRTVLRHPGMVWVGLISYPLYLWHWPLLVMGRTLMQNQHMRTTTTVALAAAFALSWLTYKFVERPARASRQTVSRRWITATATACLACVGVLGMVTAQNDGLLLRFPPEMHVLIAPHPYGADFPWSDFPSPDAPTNQAGPLLVTFGDSHAGHLWPGMLSQKRDRTFRYRAMGWGDCAPVGDVRPGDENTCREVTAANDRTFQEIKPNIIVLAAFWRQYKHLDRIEKTILDFQKLGVRRIVLIGTVPFWPKMPQSMLLEAYRADPHRRVPERLPMVDPIAAKADEKLRIIAARRGVHFISAHDLLCNSHGCLIRLGENLMQVDLSHFSAAGSRYFVNGIAERLFDRESWAESKLGKGD